MENYRNRDYPSFVLLETVHKVITKSCYSFKVNICAGVTWQLMKEVYTVIEVNNLVKKYGNHKAVNDLSFTVDKGKVVGFLGPNGAGKSTTMNMITGYIEPTGGCIKIDGIDIVKKPEEAKKHIGYLPEVPPLYPDLRIREYLMFVAQLKKVPGKRRNEEVFEIMKKTKVDDLSERLIRHLSKGYKQRVGLAAAMIGEPDILILGAPTVGLDPSQIIDMRELIRELSKNHTVLLSSHIMQEISAVCDEIIIINNGKMIAKDTPENLISMIKDSGSLHLVVKGDEQTINDVLGNMSEINDIKYDSDSEENTVGFTVFFSKETDIREKLFFAFAERGCPIIELHKKDTSLEDVFLTLTKENSERYDTDNTVNEEKEENKEEEE